MNELEILEKLHNIELNTVKTSTALTNLIERFEKMDHDVNGNGKPGIKSEITSVNSRVLVLEQNEKNFNKNMTILICVVTLIAQLGTQIVLKFI